VELGFCLKTYGFLVFGLVLIEICLFFQDFCFVDCFFSNFMALLLLQFTAKGIQYWVCFYENLLILGLVFGFASLRFIFIFLLTFRFAEVSCQRTLCPFFG